MNYVPAKEIRTEIMVVNSRFIACASRAGSVEQAKGYINKIKKDYPDATHHVPAYIIGHGATVISHCSDAGEPVGTAGRPLLSVLSGSGLGDIVVVVVRYFGGTKLGTGGLVRAYTEACQRVIEDMPRAVKVSTTTLMFELEYAQLSGARRLVNNFHGEILDEDFQVNIWLTARFISDQVESFKSSLREFGCGAIKVMDVEINPDSLFPVSPMDDWWQALPGTVADKKK